MNKRHYYLDTRVMALFFFVAMPFVAFGSFVVVNMAKGALNDSIGQNLEQRALQTKILLERYIADQVVYLRLLAVEPQLLDVLNRGRQSLGSDETKRLERGWATGTDRATLSSLLDTPLADRLRALAAIRPALRLLQVVDGQGRLVASSRRLGRLDLSDMAWFRALNAEGATGFFVGDMQRGPGGSPALLEIAYPVEDADGLLVGAVRALLDSADVYSVLAPVRVGRTGHAVLVRTSDGMILASDESERILQARFPGFDNIEAAILEKRGYWTLPEVRERGTDGTEVRVEPTRLVGYSLVDQVPGVQWLVAVEQDLEEAAAPIQGITRYLWIHFIGAFGTVILLAAYFSFKLETPVIEEDLHLHEEHMPAGMRAHEGDERGLNH
jgi:hypothetical protein